MKQKIIKLFYLLIFLVLVNGADAQNMMVEGIVYELDIDKGAGTNNEHQTHQQIKEKRGADGLSPLPGVNVYWEGTTTGTTTGVDGKFVITKPNSNNKHKLVVSFVGYQNDTLQLTDEGKPIQILLRRNIDLQEVVIEANLDGMYISKLKPLHTEVITSSGLQHLACCNLSESFENNATVDVGFTDAVTGAKQIQMLGLAGIYSQLLIENLPYVRGLSSAFGITYVPGPWMDAIQISKGTSSVVNGYESITGQINLDFKKPETAEKFYLNGYVNDESRLEFNSYKTLKLSPSWQTLLFVHGSMNNSIIDHNHDGFLDLPKTKLANVLNRWSYEKPHKMHAHIVLNVLAENREGGEKSYYEKPSEPIFNYYISKIDNKRVQLFTKTGFMLSEKNQQSLGVQTNWVYHDIVSLIGRHVCNANQAGAYANVIFQTNVKNDEHKMSMGSSFNFDFIEEAWNDTLMTNNELVYGIFSQYTNSSITNLTVIGGMRADYHNEFGVLLTPRLHTKYSITENLVVRASGGRGFRTPYLIPENIGLLASGRILVLPTDKMMEAAWNYGFNVTQDFKKDEKRTFSISADYYRTDFKNQLVIDLYRNDNEIHIYNLKGISYSNAYQAQVVIQPVKCLVTTMAFRYNEVKTTYGEQLRPKPFVNQYKGLLILNYSTKYERWRMDVTNQLNGPSKVPPVLYQAHQVKDHYSPAYYILHAQITRKFKHWHIYAGGENLLDFKQKHPVMKFTEGNKEFYDSSLIWGPVTGRMLYAGFRFVIK